MLYTNLQNILQQKFPKADFHEYFDFLEHLDILIKGGHKHHILPKKQFPEFKNNSKNCIRVSSENHFLAHYYLALASSEFDLAFFLMSNYHSVKVVQTQLTHFIKLYEQGRLKQLQVSKEIGRKAVESGQLREAASAGGRTGAGGRRSVEIHGAPGTRADKIKGTRKRNELHGNPATKESRSKGGKIGGRTSVTKGYLTRARHIRWHSKRGIVSPICELCQK
jgi:hypothetical protein